MDGLVFANRVLGFVNAPAFMQRAISNILFNTVNIEERQITQWVKDTNIQHCHNCKIQFTVLNRKHHCRNCGKIYCSKCSDFFIWQSIDRSNNRTY